MTNLDWMIIIGLFIIFAVIAAIIIEDKFMELHETLLKKITSESKPALDEKLRKELDAIIFSMTMKQYQVFHLLAHRQTIIEKIMNNAARIERMDARYSDLAFRIMFTEKEDLNRELVKLEQKINEVRREY